jgi:hypothetical protein
MVKFIVAASVVIAGIIGCTLIVLSFSTSTYVRLCSPDGQYSVTAEEYVFESFIPRFPGQAGDAAGRIVIYDEVTKKRLFRAHVPMAQLIWELVWEGPRAYFIGDQQHPTILDPWILPREVRTSLGGEKSVPCTEIRKTILPN